MNKLKLGLKIRKIREELGLSRPNFAKLFDDLPMTTLKNYELEYRTCVPGELVIQLMHHEKTKAYSEYLTNPLIAVDDIKVNTNAA